MPRNMSFAFTADQVRARTKTVTRRKGWRFLKPGDVLNACAKCMGLRPGEQIERLGLIRVVSVRREPLERMHATKYGNREAKLEGFPELTGGEFIDMYRGHFGGGIVTRIEFEYID